MIASNLRRGGHRMFLQRRIIPTKLTVLLLLSSLCKHSMTTSAFFAPTPASRSERTSFSIGHRRYASSRDDLERLTVPELKTQLRSLGLKVGGRKAELVDRLMVLGDHENGTGKLSTSPTPSTNKEEIDGSDVAVYDSVPNNAVVILACKS